ncbi:MAG: hypothetical protein DSZ11_02170 [Sulfurovum sp.]|nr:MAG: hypothetical protein DSZ11_02170 [Sulfurovum sp.]
MTLLKKSQDEKSNKADKKSLKRGGKKGHQGKTLEQVKNPDKIILLEKGVTKKPKSQNLL